MSSASSNKSKTIGSRFSCAECRADDDLRDKEEIFIVGEVARGGSVKNDQVEGMEPGEIGDQRPPRSP